MAIKICIRILVWMLVIFMALPPGVFAQGEVVSPIFRQEELDQMLAPIALYPDSLLVQILMAATYPIEVVEADRWAKANRNLTGEQLVAALEQQNWDPSVKSLINFPSVLMMMDEELGWTQKLGDAFLSQKDQVMDTVQKLRNAAEARGTLQNTNEQRVATQGQTIVIEAANPQVVYVPVYDPLVVYGPWWYPAYPPYRYYPPGAVLARNIVSFGFGFAIGAAWGYAWGGFGWNRHEVFVNVNQNININRNINRTVYVNRIGSGGRGEWQHDPVHRKGVIYRDNNVANHFGQLPRGNVDTRRDFRGYTPDSRSRPESPAGGRPTMQGQRGTPTHDRQPSQQRTTTGAFTGMDRRGSEVKAQSYRGRSSQESRATMRAPTMPGGGSVSRPTGGGAPRPGAGVASPSGTGASPRSSGVSRPGGGGGGRPSSGGGGHSGGGR